MSKRFINALVNCLQRDLFTVQLFAKRFIDSADAGKKTYSPFNCLQRVLSLYTVQLLAKRFSHCSTVGEGNHLLVKCWQRDLFTTQLLAEIHSLYIFQLLANDSVPIPLLAKRFRYCSTVGERFIYLLFKCWQAIYSLFNWWQLRDLFAVQLLTRDVFTVPVLTKGFIHLSTVGKEIKFLLNC